MTVHVGVGGAHKIVTGASVGVGGVWKNVTKAWGGVGGVWKLVFTSAPVVAAPDIYDSRPAGVAAFGSSTAVVTGGIGPFTYSWVITSGIGFSISGATTATVAATKSGPVANVAEGELTLTVTDTATGETATDAVLVYLENY